ncbi:MAG: DUF3531 family protein [Synechococcales cyanobacterium]
MAPDPTIRFQDCDWNRLWIWLHFASIPDDQAQAYVEQVIESWYSLGLLGAYNATSLPIQEAGVALSEFDYPQDLELLPAFFHNMGEVEYQHDWGRFWVDMGSADSLALDILCHALRTLSRDYVPLREIQFGGDLDEWPLDEMEP